MLPKQTKRVSLSRLGLLSVDLSSEVCNLLMDTAQKTASRLNDKEYSRTLYLECIYLFMHILSRLLFYEFGGSARDQFIRQCFEYLVNNLAPITDRQALLADLQYREQFYCRYPCLDEHNTDIGFIVHGFNHLLLENNLPHPLVNRATLLINDSCMLLLRRLASHQLRLHISH